MAYAAYAASGGGEYTLFPRRKLETRVSCSNQKIVGRLPFSITRYPLDGEMHYVGEIRTDMETTMRMLT